MPRCNRNWLSRITWPITHVIVTHLSVLAGFILFHIFNRTIFIGGSNVPTEPNTLLLSNHQSMIDSFLVGMGAFYPKVLIRPKLLPWNPAAEENFFRNPILSWLSSNWKCIPIKKGRKDVGAIYKMAEALKTGTMILFPEGTRSRDGNIGRPRGGSGLLILETRPTVIPVCIDGVNKVLPIGSIRPRCFKKVYVYYGKPIDLSQYYAKEKNKEVAKAVIENVMEQMRIMRFELQGLRRQPEIIDEKAVFESKKYDSQRI